MVSNPGKFTLDVEYDLSGPVALQLHLQVEPKSDTVAVGGQSSLTVTFCPQRKCVLKDLTLSIKVDPQLLIDLILLCMSQAQPLEPYWLEASGLIHFH